MTDERKEWQELVDWPLEAALLMPKEALIASIKYLAQKLLDLTS